MSLFSVVPVSVNDPLLPRVNRNDIQTLTEAEFGCYDHWIFDQGGVGGLTGVANGLALTQGDVTPTYGANYISVTNGPSDGLRTALNDTDVDEVTMWAVMRQPATDGTNGNKFIFGSSTGGAGIGAMLAGSGTSLTVTGRMAASGNPYAVGTVTVNSWFFLAISYRLIANSLAIRAKLNAEVVDSYTPLAGVTKSGLPFSVGNYHYATGPAAVAHQFAEFGIIRSALSSDELDGLYLRSQARMTRRSIAI